MNNPLARVFLWLMTDNPLWRWLDRKLPSAGKHGWLA